MNDLLIKLPSSEEIKNFLDGINTDKAPGPDGFSAGFFHTYWDFIGEDMCKEITRFFELNTMEPIYNKTHVCLIPKKIGAKKTSDFRPIALCSTQYKIIAKILTSRLQGLLPNLIAPF